MTLKGKSSTVENLNLDGHLIVEDGDVATGDILNKNRVDFISTKEDDPEVYKVRGYIPSTVKH